MTIPFSELAATSSLATPEPAPARHPDTITSPRELRQWLSDLPAVDSTQLVRQLSHQLSLLVRDPRPDAKFQPLLKCYHEVVESLQEQAVESRKRSPETRSHAQIGLLTSIPQLLHELANGHMRSVELRLKAGGTPDAEDIYVAQLLMRRAIHWELLEYRMFRPVVWQQIVQLYNVATLYGLECVSVDSDFRLAEDPTNTHDLFFSTLALLLADPYRLPNHCIRELEYKLPEYAAKLQMSPDKTSNQQIPLDLSGRISPLHYARQPDPSLPAHYVSFEQLLKDLSPGRLDEAGCDLDSWLEQSLGGLLAGGHERRHPRRARSADYHFVIGLKTVHERLRSLQPGNTAANPAGIECAPTLSGIPCVQNDISSSGSGFILPGNQHYPDPGEWALFELDSPAGNPPVCGFVGQIKRCMRDEDDYLRIGVERLLGNVIPVNVGPTKKPALFNANQEKSSYRLIAPHGYYEAEKVDVLVGSNKDYRVKHKKLLSREGSTEIIQLVLMG